MTNKKKKIAVILFNLGGPDSKNAIKPFLFNFFMDKNITGLPIPFRCMLAALIANKRSKREAGESYAELGNISPLLTNSKAQAAALEKTLKADKANKDVQYKTFICMRYWHPMAPQVVRDVRDWGADEIVLLPLYPQFSTTTTWSSMQIWHKAAHIADLQTPTSTICCYPTNAGFIKASAENIITEIKAAKKAGDEDLRILFSAHGLPEKIIKSGDPYQWQCEKTAAVIAEAVQKKLRLKSLDWQICYQSRVGPLKWIGPSLDVALEKAAHDKKSVVIYPHAFTQEHVETLVELDIEYKEEAEEMGLHGYYRAKTVGTHPAYIDGLAKLVKTHKGTKKIKAEGGKCVCPDKFGKCCMRVIDKLEAV